MCRCSTIYPGSVQLLLRRTDIIERTQISQSILCFACMRVSAGLITCKKQGYEGRNLIWSSKALYAKSLEKRA